MRADRRQFIVAASAGSLLTACGQNTSGKAIAAADLGLGPATAKVTVIEYASLACHVCRDFHAEIWPELKQNYIDTGKIRFIFREFPTGQPQIAAAEHLLARCMTTNEEQYFKALDVFFDQQPSVFQAAQAGQVREKLLEIARAGGLSEERFNTCIADPDQIARLNRVAEEGTRTFKIAGTPTIIINGDVVANTIAEPYTYQMLAARIDAKLR